MKVFVAHLFHESSTFSPGVTDTERFRTGAYCRGKDMLEKYEGTGHYLGGILRSAREHGYEVFPSISVGTAGPRLSRECLDHYVDEILEDLRAAMPVDGLCLALHGAGVADGVSDIESYLLEKIRAITGNDMPITCSLDLHANITGRMLRLLDGMFALKTYPHVDTFQAGYSAMECLADILEKGDRFVMTAVHIPCMLPFSNMRTDIPGPAREMMLRITEEEKAEGIRSISFLHGFCYADVPEAGMCVLIVGRKKETELCLRLARTVWDMRERMLPEVKPMLPCIDAAVGNLEDGKLCIISECSDCAGAGGPNDGTFVLHEMLKRNIPRSIFVSIWDPEVAAKCYELGTGAFFTGDIGGKADGNHGEPVHAENAEILGVSDGHFRYTTPMYIGQPYCVGKTARLKIGEVELVVNSVPRQTHDDRMIAITGSDIRFYDLIGLKSGIAFKAFYEALPNFKQTFACDPPGCCSPDMALFHFENVKDFYPNFDVREPDLYVM